MSLPLIISIPHGSDRLPPDMAPNIALTSEQISEAADLGTREIFSGLDALDFMVAGHSRYLVDLNRAPNQGGDQGVVAGRDYDGRPVFKPGLRPSPQEAARLVQRWWWPYHRRLQDALPNPKVRGLLDCHSMTGVGPPLAPDAGKLRCDVCLGNGGGPQGRAKTDNGAVTCPPRLMLALAAAFERQGLSVGINHPYAGGFITRHYGAQLMQTGRFALQIELNKSCYLDRRGLHLVPQKLKETRTAVAAALDQWTFGL